MRKRFTATDSKASSANASANIIRSCGFNASSFRSGRADRIIVWDARSNIVIPSFASCREKDDASEEIFRDGVVFSDDLSVLAFIFAPLFTSPQRLQYTEPPE